MLDGPNTNALVIFRQGAGHVRPNGAADPGLVHEHGVKRLARVPLRHDNRRQSGSVHGAPRRGLLAGPEQSQWSLNNYVFRNDATGPVLVAASLGLTPLEEANLVNPQAGEIHRVHPWVNVPGTANFTLFSSLLRTASADNTTVSAPPSATKGATGTIPLTFSGLTPRTKYLGSVAYGGTTGLPNPTIVRVDP